MRKLYRVIRQRWIEYFSKEPYLNYYGKKVYYPKGSFAVNIVLGEQSHVYELDNLKIILKNLESESYYFDVGANIGLMSVPILQLAPTVTVVSIEASPSTFKYLKQTADNAGNNGYWKIFESAIADSAKDITFHVSEPAYGVFDSFYNTQRANVAHQITIKSRKIDDIWAELGFPKVCFIKIDIEGADLLALVGAEELIQSYKPTVLIEWNEKNLQNSGCDYTEILSWADSHFYLLTTTSFTPIIGPIQLKNFMQGAEYFLLSPKLDASKN